MNSQQLVLTLYYPCVIQVLDQFIQTISLEVWLQNPQTKLWHLVAFKDGDGTNSETRVANYTYATKPRLTAFINEIHPSVEAFLQANQESGIEFPIRYKATYLTAKIAANHRLFWTWTNPESNNIERIHWNPNAIKASHDNKTDYSPMLPVTIQNGKIIAIARDDISEIHTPFSDFPVDWSENLRLAFEALKSPYPDAALELLAIMQAISEKCFCASWIMGNGHNLQSILEEWEGNSSVNYGNSEITPEQLHLMRILSKLSQGWWYWDEEHDTGEMFLTLT